MKRIILSSLVLQFLFSSLTLAQGNYSDINEFKDIWKLFNVKEIQEKIKVREKKSHLSQKEEIELALLYANDSLISKKLVLSKKYAVYMEKLIKKYSNNPIVIGNYANSILSVARDDKTLQELQLMEQFNKGMGIYNKALEGQFHDNFYLRLLRGYTCFVVPSVLNKINVAKNDFEWMVQSYEKVKSVNHFGETQEQRNDMSKIYLTLGFIYQRIGEMEKAKETFKKAYEISPESKSGKEAKEAMEIIA